MAGMAGGYQGRMPDMKGRGLTAAPDTGMVRSQQFPNDYNRNASGQYDPVLDGNWVNDNDGDEYADVAEVFADDDGMGDVTC